MLGYVPAPDTRTRVQLPIICIAMADVDQVVGTDTTSLIEQLGKAFLELKAHKDAAEDKVQWAEIEEHFCHLETMMKKKFEELEVREKEIIEKESEIHTMISEREVAVAAKEQDLSDRIQELKDAAVGAIAEARAIHLPASLELIDSGDSKESKVSTSPGDANAHLAALEENSPHRTGENVEVVAGEVKPRPELTQFCEQMDAKGLLNFTMENQKNKSAICAELSVALESATEPGRLVLASLEGFYPPDDSTQEGDIRDAAFQGMRQSCLILMEAMATLLARADPGADHLLNPEIKQQAKVIADEWKPKLAGEGIDAANGNSLEAEAFLQLLGTFSIASEFDEEELCKLVLAVAHQRRAPELCHSLGLAHKIPGVVEELINNEKQIHAVHFVHSFQLTERFPLVPLLKTYLKDLRRNSQGKGSRLGGASGQQNDANAQELTAVKAVIWCIQEYKLEEDYPLDPLQRRVGQLEKSKPDRKRFGDFGKKQQFKKPRANGVYGFRAPATATAAAAAGGGRQAPTVFAERTTYAGTSERYPYAGPSTYDYQAPSGQAAYPQQAYDQRSYYYPQDERVTATTYSAAPSSYGSYMGSATQPSHQPYM
ncbi:FRIGIDA-like protein 3 isoform X2 [Cornus florida]|nr:FRIGIDA-like protein 3 isoform X2 [Cornus florida]XP_059623962.1 FRIGIDA-like protein 3 isoform X2 [Cornus florida]